MESEDEIPHQDTRSSSRPTSSSKWIGKVCVSRKKHRRESSKEGRKEKDKESADLKKDNNLLADEVYKLKKENADFRMLDKSR